MQNPLVSVVMATYTGDDFDHLTEAVSSVLAQTYPNIELLIVVDGPVAADRKAYLDDVANHPKVNTIFLAKNSGPANARNVGIVAAQGEFIAIMDADDVSVDDRIEHQLGYLGANALDLMSSFLEVIDNEGNVLGVRQLPTSSEKVRALAPYRCPLHNPSAFGTAEAFKSHLYDVRYRVSEDYDLWVRLLRAGYRLGNSPHCCVRYRQSHAATEKRRGMRYALADARVKLSARKMAKFTQRPAVILFAVCSSAVRLLPSGVFRLIYAFRTGRVSARGIG